MPIRWSASKVAESLDELERLLVEAEPILRECQKTASETQKLPNLAGYISEPLMMFDSKIGDFIRGMHHRINRMREYIPKEALAKEQHKLEKYKEVFGDQAQMAMELWG